MRDLINDMRVLMFICRDIKELRQFWESEGFQKEFIKCSIYERAELVRYKDSRKKILLKNENNIRSKERT